MTRIPRIFSVGTDPGPTFVGNFNGQTDLVTVNAGSNDLTLIANFDGSNPTTSTIASGGVEPDTAFAFDAGSGFEDLVVGNGGDGVLSLFEGGPDGLGLTSAATEPNLPDPTALAFSALTGGQVQFYAATAGRESAELVALSLGIETSISILASTLSTSSLTTTAQLVSLHETSLPLVVTFLTLTIEVSGSEELGIAPGESAAFSVGAFLPATGTSVGQGLSSSWRGGGSGTDGTSPADESGTSVGGAAPVGHLALGAIHPGSGRGTEGVPAREHGRDTGSPRNEFVQRSSRVATGIGRARPGEPDEPAVGARSGAGRRRAGSPECAESVRRVRLRGRGRGHPVALGRRRHNAGQVVAAD